MPIIRTNIGMKCREYRLRVNGRDVNKDRREKACLVSEGQWEVQK